MVGHIKGLVVIFMISHWTRMVPDRPSGMFPALSTGLAWSAPSISSSVKCGWKYPVSRVKELFIKYLAQGRGWRHQWDCVNRLMGARASVGSPEHPIFESRTEAVASTILLPTSLQAPVERGHRAPSDCALQHVEKPSHQGQPGNKMLPLHPFLGLP